MRAVQSVETDKNRDLSYLKGIIDVTAFLWPSKL